MASDNLKCGSPLFPPRPPSGVPRVMPPSRPPVFPRVPVLTVNGEGPDRSGNVAVDVGGKADKVADPTDGNFAGLDGSGNLVDSGSKASDFQPRLTFDNAPTEGSQNPVTSGGIKQAIDAATPADYDQVKAQVGENADDIAGIEAVIPNQASAQNQLADKEFVNSSIATNTATFRGTYNLVSDLSLAVSATEQQVAAAIAAKLASLVPPVDPENNDYCFVQVPYDETPVDPEHVERIDRYKCTVAESGGVTTRTWGYEFSLNNSSFTAVQWAAINSGVTAAAVQKLAGIAAGAQVNVIEAVKVNGTALAPEEKAVDITVPEPGNSVPPRAEGDGAIGSNWERYATGDHKHPAETAAELKAFALPDDVFPITYTGGTIASRIYCGLETYGDNYLILKDTSGGMPYKSVAVFAADGSWAFDSVAFGVNDVLFNGQRGQRGVWPRMTTVQKRLAVRGTDVAALANIAPAFSTSATYAADSLVRYQDVVYICHTAVTTAGAWTGSANWTFSGATVEDVLAALRSALEDKAPLASPAFTGTPTAPTPTASDNSTKVATTAFVQGEIAGKANSAAIAPEFSTSSTYAVSDVVMYGGLRYKCTTAVSTAGAWNAANWTSEPVQTALDAKANASDLRYSINAATVSSGTTPTVTNILDRADNTATLGSSVTAATVTLPAATAGKMRDFFIALTVEGSTAPSLTWIDPATQTDADIAVGEDSLADIDTGLNVIMFSAAAGQNRWLVSVKHEEAVS